MAEPESRALTNGKSRQNDHDTSGRNSVVTEEVAGDVTQSPRNECHDDRNRNPKESKAIVKRALV
jgi:hypothetical protein